MYSFLGHFIVSKKTLKFEIIIDPRNGNKTRAEISRALHPVFPSAPGAPISRNQSAARRGQLTSSTALTSGCVHTLPCHSVTCTFTSPPPRSTTELFHAPASLGLPHVSPSTDSHGSGLTVRNCVILRLLHKWNHTVYNL